MHNLSLAAALAILTIAFLYVLLPYCLGFFLRYRKPRVVACPQSGQDAIVHVDALRAAIWAPFHEQPEVKACSEWPRRRSCDQRCALNR